MRTRYDLNEGGYLLGYHLTATRYWVGDLWVNPMMRRLGVATRLMQLLIADADRERIELRLDPVPGENILFCDLCDFYAEFGFHDYVIGNDHLMRRLPQC